MILGTKPMKKGGTSKSKCVKKKKKVNVRLIFFILILLIIASSIALLCTLSIFNLTTINVSGNSKYSIDEIVNASEFNLGKNVFLQAFGKHTEKVVSLPYVKSASIRYSFKGSISIDVVERTGYYVAYDKDNNRYFRLDQEGYILEEINISDKTNDEILIYGINFDNEVALGVRINDIDISKLAIYANIINEFRRADINDDVTKVNFENSLTTLTLNDKLSVIMPNDTEVRYKVALLQQIMLSISSDAAGIIDMTRKDPVYSTF